MAITTRTITALFLTLLVAVPIVQWCADRAEKREALTLRLAAEMPTAASLHALEQDVLDRSVTLEYFRPKSQWFRFRLFGDAGSKVLLGEHDWMFYRPGIEAAVLRGSRPDTAVAQALTAIVDFRDALAKRGIGLLVVPVPNKESVYPDQLTVTHTQQHHWHQLDSLFEGMRSAGVNALDLRTTFARARDAGVDTETPLYLTQDSHWSPSGLSLAAQTIASTIRPMLAVDKSSQYSTRPVLLERHGDLIAMLQSPEISQDVAPESITAVQVLDSAGQPVRSELDSQVLLLGDSFLRIFERDAPLSAGLASHLTLELGQSLTVLMADGGASTLVRQNLYRRPDMLRGKQLVIWEFVERDLRLGNEGWQKVPLPPK